MYTDKFFYTVLPTKELYNHQRNPKKDEEKHNLQQLRYYNYTPGLLNPGCPV